MAINTEVLPVGTISRIIEAVPVLMMHRKKTPVLGAKLPPAFGADKPVYFE